MVEVQDLRFKPAPELTAEFIQGQGVRLTWEPVSTALGFTIYRQKIGEQVSQYTPDPSRAVSIDDPAYLTRLYPTSYSYVDSEIERIHYPPKATSKRYSFQQKERTSTEASIFLLGD